MKHLTEDEQILFFYGESPDPGADERHLESCESCARELDRLRRTLELVDAHDRATVPEPDAAFGREMWARVAPELERGRQEPVRFWSPMRLTLAGAIAAGLLIAFVTGLFVGRSGEVPDGSGLAQAPPQERIVLIAVGDHLESSQRLIVELVNASTEGGTVDLSRHRQRAAELAGTNRVYRRGAAAAGEAMIAEVLDELERTLLEIAHVADEAAAEDLEELRRRIERRGILMKIRVLGDAEREPPAGRESARAADAA